MRPTPELWQSAKQPFLEVLDELKPDLIIVLGAGLSQNLPTIPDAITVLKIYHPSYSGFSYAKCMPNLEAAIKVAKSNLLKPS